ncbi:hypothetical protein [Labedella endophytica]|uniref:Oligosaccharide repeat unit polymerase n=1 Tax=Labedella endophytica TaxID=1523160 RepID=A0A433JSD2_9MICO|nr:hypothetical protein [Labedella endophytica]RUR01226.1 hypothetical protein ELQ94_06840 [Labedella endophytica]
MIALSAVVAMITLLYMVATSPVRGLGRFVAPDTTAAVMLAMIFGVRPLFTDRFEIRTMYGLIPDTNALDTAMTVGVVSLSFFGFGAFIAAVRPTRAAIFSKQSAPIERREVRLTAGGVLGISVFAIALYVAAIIVLAGPSSLTALSGGRSEDATLGGVPEFVLVIPMAGSVAATIFFISRRNRQIHVFELLLILAAIAISLTALSQLGNRRFLIPGLLIPLVAALIRSPVRLKAWHLVLGVVGFLFLAIVPMVRSAGARMPGENLLTASLRYFGDEGFRGVLTPVFASYDTEMLDYIAVFAGQPNPEYGLGRGTLLEFLARPLPGDVFGTAFSDQVLTSIWGGGCGQPYCPVGSLAGVLYFDGGLPAVAVGSFLFGIAVRFIANRWAFNSMLSTVSASSIAVVSGFALVAARTNTVHAIWWCVYVLLLMAGIYLISSRRMDGQASLAKAPGERLEVRENLRDGDRSLAGDRRADGALS